MASGTLLRCFFALCRRAKVVELPKHLLHSRSFEGVIIEIGLGRAHSTHVECHRRFAARNYGVDVVAQFDARGNAKVEILYGALAANRAFFEVVEMRAWKVW